MNPLHNNVFAIAIAIAKRFFNGFFRFATIGSLLCEPILRITTIKTADCRVFKMATGFSKCLPAVFRRHFLLHRHPKMAALWRILAGRAGIAAIGTHWMVFNVFQWAFLFRLMRISLYSDFTGTDYPRQAKHHCIWEIWVWLVRRMYSNCKIKYKIVIVDLETWRYVWIIIKTYLINKCVLFKRQWWMDLHLSLEKYVDLVINWWQRMKRSLVCLQVLCGRKITRGNKCHRGLQRL